MAESKHTPGPWQVRDDVTPEGRREIIANVDGEYVEGAAVCVYDTIAVCEDAYGETLPNAEANARLIAAAPVLLEALKALQLQALQSLDLTRAEWGQEALAKTAAAIAAAEGRTDA